MKVYEPKNKKGHKITSIWAFISVDADGDEGLCAVPLNGIMMPMIASDQERLEIMRKQAKELAKATNQKIKLIELTTRKEVKTFFA